MAKKLTEDQINWILSVDASDAQQEIHKLTKANKELIKTNKERSQMLRELEAQGKKETDAYRNLSAEIKKTSSTISSNNRVMDELQKKLGLTGLSMVQLRKKAKDLQRQLDQTVKSASPEEYEALEKELAAVRGRMDELRTSGGRVENSMKGFEAGVSKVKAAVKLFIAVKLVSYLKDCARAAYNTRKEFARYEAVLRNNTGSAKAAAKAMQMIQRLASDTPASVAEWTDAYIKLINRGLKPTTEELTSIGDVATSQGKSIDQYIEAFLDAMTGENERLKEFGIKAKKNGDTTAFTFKGVTTEVQNTEAAIKNYLVSLGKLQGVQGSMATQMTELAGLESNLGDQIDSINNKIGKKMEPMIKKFFGWLGGALGDISGALDSANEKYDQQKDKTVGLVSTIPGLISKYDELSEKTSLSTSEQDELRLVIERIGNMVPGAVTAFDQYGRALDISKDKVHAFVQEQKLLLQYQNQAAISETEGNLKTYRRKLGEAKSAYNQGGKTKSVFTGPGMAPMTYVDKNSLAEVEQDIKKYGDLVKGAELELERLKGDSLEKTLKANEEQRKQRESFNKMNKAQLDEWIKDEKNAASEYMSIAKDIYTSRFGGGGSNDDKAVKDALERQKLIYEQKQIELKERYVTGNDEQLQTQSQFQKASEELLLQDLNARLQIFGLEVEQRKQIENQILDIRVKAMEDFKTKKAELEREQITVSRQTNEEAMAENQKWMAAEAKRLQEEHQQRVDIIQKSLQAQVDQYKDYGTQIGNSLGQVLSGQEDMLAAFGDTMVDILFDVLSQIINQKIAEATAVAVAEQAKAAAISAAQPDSVMTFGATAAARTAVIGGLIMAALGTAKSALKGLLSKQSKSTVTTSSSGETFYTRVPGKQSGGSINVMREQDGRMFPDASFDPAARGFISRPTVIVGEGPAGQSKEWVASNAAVTNPTVSPLLNIIDQAQQAGTIRSLDMSKYIGAIQCGGRSAGGNVGTIPAIDTRVVGADSKMESALAKFTEILKTVSEEGIPAYTVLDEFEKKQTLRNKSRKIGSK